MTLPLWFDRIVSDANSDDATPQRRFAVSCVESAGHDDQSLLVELASAEVHVAAAALEVVFRSWYAKLMAFARVVTGDESAAQDIVQEIFLDLWRRRTTVVLMTSFAAYLHGAVRHRALTGRRDAANRARLLGTISAAEYAETMVAAPALPNESESERESDDDRRFRAIVAAADTLPPRAREVFYLRWRQSLSYKEIAIVMGISVKTIEAQMTIAMRRVREALRGL